MLKKIAVGLGIAVVLAGSAMAQGLSRYQIRLINNTSTGVLSVYARNLATDQLYGDLLGNRMISAGGFSTFNLDDSSGTCNWRVQADMVDGRTIRRNINVCNTTSWTLVD